MRKFLASLAALFLPLAASAGIVSGGASGNGMLVTATGSSTARPLKDWLSVEEVIRPSGDATGATDVANINAVTAAGKAVRLVSGVYYLNATLNLGDAATKRGYTIRGTAPVIAADWSSILAGTELRAVGTGFPAMQYAPTTYVAQPSISDAHAQHLQSVEVSDIAFTGFTYAILGGRMYNASFMHSTFRNLYSLGATQWAFWFENFQEDVFEKLVAFPATTATGAMMFAASFKNFTDGNSLMLHLFSQASGTAFQRGIVFRAYGDATGLVALNDVNVYDVQHNGVGRSVTATLTSSGGTALTLSGYSGGESIASFPVDLQITPDAVSTTALTPYVSYFVKTNDGANTITLADYQGGPAKTIPAGSVTVHATGFPAIEIVGYGDYGWIQPSTFSGIDAETWGGCAVLLQRGNISVSTGTASPYPSLTGPFSTFVLRNVEGNLTPAANYSADFDSNSKNKTIVAGGGGVVTDSVSAAAALPNGPASGIRRDRATTTTILNLGSNGGGIEGVAPWLRFSGANFRIQDPTGGTTYATFDTGGNLALMGGMQPGTPNHGANAGRIYQGSGAPGSNYANDGDFYFRTDTPGVANQRLYVRSGGSWVGIL